MFFGRPGQKLVERDGERHEVLVRVRLWRMRNHILMLWMLVAVTGVGVTAQSPADERLIRESRAASNAAIVKHDTAGIARYWMNDVHITTSTSAHATGREPNQERMAQQFQRRPDTIYVRTPSTIAVLAAWAVASERGEWTGRWTEPDGVVEISGTYLGQWRKIGGQWVTQSELYVPTRCTGSQYCTKRP